MKLLEIQTFSQNTDQIETTFLKKSVLQTKNIHTDLIVITAILSYLFYTCPQLHKSVVLIVKSNILKIPEHVMEDILNFLNPLRK